MKENRLLLCIHQIGDLGKNNSKYFTFMNYFDRRIFVETIHSHFVKVLKNLGLKETACGFQNEISTGLHVKV